MMLAVTHHLSTVVRESSLHENPFIDYVNTSTQGKSSNQNNHLLSNQELTPNQNSSFIN